MSALAIPDAVLSVLEDARKKQEAKKSVVIMTCGIAGAGKSTFAMAITKLYPDFTRLSIDEIIAGMYGLYGVDYAPSYYESHQEDADDVYVAQFRHLLKSGKNVILDKSFYAKSDRDEYKAMADACGGQVTLVYLKADRDLLWRRICSRRSHGVDANSALDITSELLDEYVAGFEEPSGEGEIVVHVHS